MSFPVQFLTLLDYATPSLGFHRQGLRGKEVVLCEDDPQEIRQACDVCQTLYVKEAAGMGAQAFAALRRLSAIPPLGELKQSLPATIASSTEPSAAGKSLGCNILQRPNKVMPGFCPSQSLPRTGATFAGNQRPHSRLSSGTLEP